MDDFRIDTFTSNVNQRLGQAGATGGLLLCLGVLIVLVLMTTVRVGRVSGEEVGVMLNKITGKTTVVAQSGVRVYNGLTHRLYVLDKTLQTLEMTGTVGQGDREERDDIKIKTSDGSDVYVDLKVQYRVISEEADTVLRSSGVGDAFKQKWARDYVRSSVRNHLGKLTTEGFYDAARRNALIADARAYLRERLLPQGIQIDSIVLPTRPRFYAEYETMIKKKKLADQQALEEESKADAAKQRQQTEVVEATNEKNVALEEFKGQMQQMIIDADAEAEKTRKGADGYYDRVSIGAEAELYQKRLDAEGILATKEAEAQGLEALRNALAGDGGRNMVKLEYARSLNGVTISGQPYETRSLVSRFEHVAASPAARESAKAAVSDAGAREAESRNQQDRR